MESSELKRLAEDVVATRNLSFYGSADIVLLAQAYLDSIKEPNPGEVLTWEQFVELFSSTMPKVPMTRIEDELIWVTWAKKELCKLRQKLSDRQEEYVAEIQKVKQELERTTSQMLDISNQNHNLIETYKEFKEITCSSYSELIYTVQKFEKRMDAVIEGVLPGVPLDLVAKNADLIEQLAEQKDCIRNLRSQVSINVEQICDLQERFDDAKNCIRLQEEKLDENERLKSDIGIMQQSIRLVTSQNSELKVENCNLKKRLIKARNICVSLIDGAGLKHFLEYSSSSSASIARDRVREFVNQSDTLFSGMPSEVEEDQSHAPVTIKRLEIENSLLRSNLASKENLIEIREREFKRHFDLPYVKLGQALEAWAKETLGKQVQ